MDAHGVIFGSSSPTRFKFVSEDPVEVGEYVEVDHGGRPVLARVDDVTYRSNLSADTALSLEAPDPGPLQATARVLGVRRGGRSEAPRAPFPPGARVRRASPDTIRRGLGLGEDGCYVGRLRDTDLPVRLDVDTLVQKQVAVLAKTGAGKSYVVGVLVEELAKSDVPVVIVDPHGEHTSLRHPNLDAGDHRSMERFGVKPRGHRDRVREVTPDVDVNPEGEALRLDGRNLAADEICRLGNLSGYAENLVHAVVQELRQDGGDYTLEDVKRRVVAKENGSWQVVTALDYIQNLGLFGADPIDVEELVQPGQVTVVNLRGTPPDVQEAVVARLSGQLFEARKRRRIPPLMLVVEEAHAFCPERNLGSAMSQSMLRTLASEGRKFGLGMTVVTQRPAKVDKNVLSQTNSQFILQVTNKNDLNAIARSIEGSIPDLKDQLQRLGTGVSLVTFPELSQPVFVEVRPRESRHGGAGVPVTEAIEDARAGADEPDEADRAPAPEDDDGDDDEQEEPEVEALPAPAEALSALGP